MPGGKSMREFFTTLLLRIKLLCVAFGCVKDVTNQSKYYTKLKEYNIRLFASPRNMIYVVRNNKIILKSYKPRFEVMYNTWKEDFIFIIHNTGNHGVSFQSIVYKGGVFHGLTSNYVLFKETDGSITAVSLKEKEHCEIGEYCFYVEDFENLSETEQKTAIYPNGYYQCKF